MTNLAVYALRSFTSSPFVLWHQAVVRDIGTHTSSMMDSLEALELAGGTSIFRAVAGDVDGSDAAGQITIGNGAALLRIFTWPDRSSGLVL